MVVNAHQAKDKATQLILWRREAATQFFIIRLATVSLFHPNYLVILNNSLFIPLLQDRYVSDNVLIKYELLLQGHLWPTNSTQPALQVVSDLTAAAMNNKRLNKHSIFSTFKVNIYPGKLLLSTELLVTPAFAITQLLACVGPRDYACPESPALTVLPQ